MGNQYYTDIYSKRLNRYGTDYQSRIEGIRAKEFEDFLLKSPNRVDFEFNGEMVAAVLEQYKQDYSETQGYLLTRKDLDIPNGTMIYLTNKEGQEGHWMVWWLEQIKTSGYHRYVILKMNCILEWQEEGQTKSSQAYFSSTGAKTIRDTVVEGFDKARFLENNNLYMFITTYQEAFVKDQYLEISNGKQRSSFRIVQFDHQATDGVSYLSVEEVAKKDFSPVPEATPDDKKEDFFWFTGGDK